MAKRRHNNPQPQQAKAQPELIVQEINMVSPDRNRKDAGTLKAAIMQAESINLPNRVRLYDFYHDVVSLDGWLSGLLEKRTGAILNKNIKFTDKSGKKIDAMDALIYSNKFNDLINIMMESRYWGLSGVEFIVGKDFDFQEIPRKHIRIESGQITKSQYSNTGYTIKDLPYCWVVGKSYDFGKLLQCSLYATYKRSGFGDFAQYVEIFGQPVRLIYYDAYDTKTRQELRQVLDESGSSLTMMIPKQAQFQMLDGKTSNGNGELQDKLISACNDEMSVAILGNSETTGSSKGSGYAQSKEHAKQQLEITKSDMVFIQNLLNSEKFITVLRAFGYPVEGGSFEFEKEIDLETLTIRLDIDLKVSEKVPFAPNYWYDTYGIDKPTAVEIKEAKEMAQGFEADGESKVENNPDTLAEELPDKEKEQKNEEEKDKLLILKKDKGIFQKLQDFFFGTQTLIDLNEYYKPCGCTPEQLPDLLDNWDDIYEAVARDLLTHKLKGNDLPPDIYFKNAEKLKQAIFNGLGTDLPHEQLNSIKPYLLRNIYQFSAAKSYTELVAFRDAMLDDTGNIVPFAEFKNRVTELGAKFNETYLKTEYETAYSSALMAKNWEQYQDDDLLEFVTVGDEKVRESHRKLHGKTYPKKHPIWQKMFPPLDFYCRCVVMPGLERNYKPENAQNDERFAGKLVKGTIFDNNVGQTRIIFKDDHPYYENLSTGKMKQLSWANYGLKSAEKMQLQKGAPQMQSFKDKQEYEAFWKKETNHPKGIRITDPLGIDVLFTDYELARKGKARNCFKQHIGNRIDEPDRYKLGKELLSIIEQPDEIWSVNNKTNEVPTFQYIKFFDDRTLIVLVVENEGRTLFEHTKIGFTMRHGILLYKK